MKIEVNNSYTIDYVSWTCPMCGHLEEAFSIADNIGVCTKCGFEIPNYSSKIGETDGEVDIYNIEEDEEFPNLCMWYECPNCGTLVEEEGQYCEDCVMEMGAE